MKIMTKRRQTQQSVEVGLILTIIYSERRIIHKLHTSILLNYKVFYKNLIQYKVPSN